MTSQEGCCPRGILCADDARSPTGNEGAQEGRHCQYWECSCYCGAIWPIVLRVCWDKGVAHHHCVLQYRLDRSCTRALLSASFCSAYLRYSRLLALQKGEIAASQH